MPDSVDSALEERRATKRAERGAGRFRPTTFTKSSGSSDSEGRGVDERSTSGQVLSELLDDFLEIRIARTELACEPVPTAPDHQLPVRDEVELTGLAGLESDVDAQSPLDQGCETRSL